MPHAIRIHEPGSPDVMRWEPTPLAAPGPGQALIRQTVVGLNYIDIYHRTGLYPQPLPATLGMEGAGVVEAIGPGVTDLRPGDRVAYAGVFGAYAEERLIPADRLVKLPDDITDEQAASMMLQGMTAEFLLHRAYQVKPGDTILVHAAAGGVGLIMCQWARALGATVIGTVSTEEKARQAAANGCHHPIIYTKEDFVARVNEITKGEKLPVVYDSVGRDTFLRSLDCLRPMGLLALFGQASGAVAPFDPALLMQKGSLFLTRPSLMHYTARRPDLLASANRLFEAVRRGDVKIATNQKYPLREAAQAHRDLESRKTTGSTVLVV